MAMACGTSSASSPTDLVAGLIELFMHRNLRGAAGGHHDLCHTPAVMPIEAPIPFDSVPLFASLKKEDREALAPLCRLRGYEKGETIFNEGDPADRIHFVVLGRVKV